MSDKGAPRWVDDGLIVHGNVTVYVCDSDDPMAYGYDVHIDVSEDDSHEHIMFDNTATLCDRSTLRESWGDAAEWLRETAGRMEEFASWIDSHMDELGVEVER